MFVNINEENLNNVAIHYKSAFCGSPWEVDLVERRVLEYMKHPLFRGYANIVGDVVIGAAFGILQQSYEGLRYNLTDLFTSPEYQNQGYATELLKYIKLQLKNESVTQIVLISLNDQLHNHFYNCKNGFDTRNDLCVKRLII